jgi:hypothetical protein
MTSSDMRSDVRSYFPSLIHLCLRHFSLKHAPARSVLGRKLLRLLEHFLAIHFRVAREQDVRALLRRRFVVGRVEQLLRRARRDERARVARAQALVVRALARDVGASGEWRA